MSLELDDGACVELRRDVADERSFNGGAEVTLADLDEARSKSEVRHARAVGLRYLNERPRSIKELKDRLKRDDLSQQAIDEVVDEFVGLGYLDDDAFARLWAESLATSRPKGRKLLFRELAQKGVDREIVNQVIEAHYPPDSDLARGIAAQRARSLGHLDRETFRRRLGGYLSRRGFDYGTIAPILDDLWDEENLERSAEP